METSALQLSEIQQWGLSAEIEEENACWDYTVLSANRNAVGLKNRRTNQRCNCKSGDIYVLRIEKKNNSGALAEEALARRRESALKLSKSPV